jgi:hypothetical protein
MAEWFEAHAWKLIPFACADAHQIAPTYSRSTTSRNNDLLQRVPVNDGVAPGFRGACDTVLTQFSFPLQTTHVPTHTESRLSRGPIDPALRHQSSQSAPAESRSDVLEDAFEHVGAVLHTQCAAVRAAARRNHHLSASNFGDSRRVSRPTWTSRWNSNPTRFARATLLNRARGTAARADWGTLERSAPGGDDDFRGTVRSTRADRDPGDGAQAHPMTRLTRSIAG